MKKGPMWGAIVLLLIAVKLISDQQTADVNHAASQRELGYMKERRSERARIDLDRRYMDYCRQHPSC
jgi:hypothetical protein